MRLWVLGSGSKGNAMLLECGETRVLIDAGFSPREMLRRLATIGVAPASIEAVVLTHEHGDHVRGATAAATRWGWALHATTGTANACPELMRAGIRTFAPGATLVFARADVETVPVPHDAAEPVAFVATEHATGARTGIAYDFGSITATLHGRLRDLDLLVLEANHDEGMLRAGPYPPSVQHRIASDRGHLSNRAAAMLARACAHRGMRQVVLAHISEQCNDRAIAARTVSGALTKTRFSGRVHVTLQGSAVGPFGPHPGGAVRPQQLALDL